MIKSTNKTLRFTRIHAENWRNFSRIGVDLQRRAFMVGPNASGNWTYSGSFTTSSLWGVGYRRP